MLSSTNQQPVSVTRDNRAGKIVKFTFRIHKSFLNNGCNPFVQETF